MICIGIDPDVDKSGFAAWDTGLYRFIEIEDYKFFDLLTRIDVYVSGGGHIKVIVEAGWLNRVSNFHGSTKQSKRAGEKVAKNVGANHQVGKLIVEYCKANNINVSEEKPNPKKWGKSENNKISAREFEQLTGWKKRTNPEKRDAAMMVIGL